MSRKRLHKGGYVVYNSYHILLLYILTEILFMVLLSLEKKEEHPHQTCMILGIPQVSISLIATISSIASLRMSFVL